MDKQGLLNKISFILQDLKSQHLKLTGNVDRIPEIDLELFMANARYLIQHLEVLQKINGSSPDVRARDEILKNLFKEHQQASSELDKENLPNDTIPEEPKPEEVPEPGKLEPRTEPRTILSLENKQGVFAPELERRAAMLAAQQAAEKEAKAREAASRNANIQRREESLNDSYRPALRPPTSEFDELINSMVSPSKVSDPASSEEPLAFESKKEVPVTTRMQEEENRSGSDNGIEQPLAGKQESDEQTHEEAREVKAVSQETREEPFKAASAYPEQHPDDIPDVNSLPLLMSLAEPEPPEDPDDHDPSGLPKEQEMPAAQHISESEVRDAASDRHTDLNDSEIRNNVVNGLNIANSEYSTSDRNIGFTPHYNIAPKPAQNVAKVIDLNSSFQNSPSRIPQRDPEPELPKAPVPPQPSVHNAFLNSNERTPSSTQPERQQQKNQTGKSVHDMIAAQRKEPSLLNKLGNLPVKDIRKAIGLNEHLLFIKTLFNGDPNAYDRTLSTIDSLKNSQQAHEFINNKIAIEFMWDNKKAVAELFKNIVNRKFSGT